MFFKTAFDPAMYREIGLVTVVLYLGAYMNFNPYLDIS